MDILDYTYIMHLTDAFIQLILHSQDTINKVMLSLNQTHDLAIVSVMFYSLSTDMLCIFHLL